MTVASVAERAGVSTTTVSLILSERPEYLRQFHPDTIRRVREAARRLGYHGNLFASGLPTRASPFFALVLREESTEEISSWHQWSWNSSRAWSEIRQQQHQSCGEKSAQGVRQREKTKRFAQRRQGQVS